MSILQVAVPIHEESQSGEARRAVLQLAERVGLNDEDAGRAGIVVTEAGRNLSKHAHGGQIVLRGINTGPGAIEVLAIDKGPGILSVTDAFRDGYSTAGTPGTGLGAIRRISDCFDLFTQPDHGTVLFSRICARGAASRVPVDTAVICVPLQGEVACGDNWSLKHLGRKMTFMIADGLGHGFVAAEAADEAVRVFSETTSRQPPEIIQDMHNALRATRGAAVGIAEMNFDASEVKYTAVGNVSAAVVTASSLKQMIYSNGTVGAEMRKTPREFSYPFPSGATLIMHSDGLATWNLERYPGLLAKSPAVIAGVLYRDFRRVRDDVTVIVAREARS